VVVYCVKGLERKQDTLSLHKVVRKRGDQSIRKKGNRCRYLLLFQREVLPFFQARKEGRGASTFIREGEKVYPIRRRVG